MSLYFSAMVSHFKFRFSLVIMLMAILAGCGNEQPKGAGLPDPVEACELLSKSVVESMIGGTVDEPHRTHNVNEDQKHWMSMCNYYSQEKGISIGITVIPHGRKVNGAEAFALYEAELKENLEGYQMEPVTGVGEYAGWEEGSKQLTIFQGPYMLILTAGSPEIAGNDALDLSKQLAGKVLPNLD